MQAYYVYDEKKNADLLVVPQKNCMVPVNRKLMENFISVIPDFSQIQGQALKGLPPDALGTVVATRDEAGDVCVVEMAVWHERMAAFLGGR